MLRLLSHNARLIMCCALVCWCAAPAAPLLFGPPGCGVVLLPSSIARDSRRLLSCVSQHSISRLVLVPSLLDALVEELRTSPADGQSLRVVSVSGETLPTALVARCRRVLPSCTLLNLFGSTEAAGDYLCFEVPSQQMPLVDSSVPIPIGRPGSISNCAVFLLNAQQDCISCTDTETIGELFVGGPHVAAGYLNEPQRTGEVFIRSGLHTTGPLCRTGDRASWTDGGLLYFRGRIDRQVKLRGQRIELDEVESTILKNVDRIEAAAVILHEGRLVAFVAPESISVHAVRDSCLKRLPVYMTPELIRTLAELPTTTSGKVDRQALHAVLATPMRQREPPNHTGLADGILSNERRAVEGAISVLWQELLHLSDTPTRDDSWFELGGTSIQVPGMLERLGTTISAISGQVVSQLSFADVFATPTVAGLCGCAYGGADHQPSHKRRRSLPPTGGERKVLDVTETMQLHSVTERVIVDGSKGWIMAASAVARVRESVYRGQRHCWIDDCDEEPGATSTAQYAVNFDAICQLEPAWSYGVGKCIDGPPAWLLGVDGGGLVVVASHAGVVAAVSANNGSERWRRQLAGRVDAGVCVCITAAGERQLVVIGSYNGVVYFLDATDGTIAWEFATGDEVKCLASVETGERSGGSVVWVGSHDRSVYALSVAQLPGQCVYRLRTGGSVIARPLCTSLSSSAEGTPSEVLRILVASQDGTVRAVERSGKDSPEEDAYRMAWEIAVGAPVFAGVVAVRELEMAIVADVTGAVRAVELRSGVVRWTAKWQCDSSSSTDGVFATPTVLPKGGAVLVPFRSGTLRCLSTADGTLMWETRLSTSPLTSTAVDSALSRGISGAVACVAAADGTVTVFHAALEGERREGFQVLAETKLGAAAFGSPLMHRGMLVVGCRDDKLHSLRVSTARMPQAVTSGSE